MSGIQVELSEAGPYLVSALVGLITAWLTHKRANKAHSDTIVIDQQKLVNDTYEHVLTQLRTELRRRQSVHDDERSVWHVREQELKSQVSELREQVQSLEEKVEDLKQAEQHVEETQHTHLQDDARHVDRRSRPRDEDDSGTDLPI